MKSSLYASLLVLTFCLVPLANAGQSPDPELENAYSAFAQARVCVPPPYFSVQCMTHAGGGAEVRFNKNGGEIIAQAIQVGSAPREWRVYADNEVTSCTMLEDGEFTSKGQGFHPWKRDLLDFCNACVDDASCLTLLP